jgi:hypothetical protein
VLVTSADLSAWSGGGFGMFSTTDAGPDRHLHAFALRPGIRREIRVPRSLRESELRALTLPTEGNLRRLADRLADEPTPDAGPLEAIVVQVWSTRFDPATLQPEATMLRSVTVAIEEP